MLSNKRGDKHKDVDISESQWKQMLHHIRDGIIRKLDASESLLIFDKDISAGLYTFALEEFGKILLLERSKRVTNNTKRRVIYAGEFTDHPKKFQEAINYLNKGHKECLVLKGGFSQGFSDNFDKVLLADLEARLSIFFSDLAYDNKHEPVIQKPPGVNINKLKVAINKLKTVVKEYPLPQ